MQFSDKTMLTGTLTKTEMLHALAMGEEKAFDFFFRTYYPALCVFANSYIRSEEEARDLVQECFVKLWENHAMMQKEDHIQSFLYTVVRNRCIDRIRRKKVESARRSGYEYLAEHWSGEELNEVARTETLRRIVEAAEMLPQKIKRVFKMHYMEGKNYHQIAEELQVSPKTVRNQKLRALVLLRNRLVLFSLLTGNIGLFFLQWFVF